MTHGEFDWLPTTHFLVRKGIIGSDGQTLPWKGCTMFRGVFTSVEVGWKPGQTDIEIGNRFGAERWEIREVLANMVMLRQTAVGVRSIVLGPEKKDSEWWAAGSGFNSRLLYFKARNYVGWVTVPTHVASFPQRLVVDIDRETTRAYLPKGISVDQVVESFMVLRRVIESSRPLSR